jgi:hypothetical protein
MNPDLTNVQGISIRACVLIGAICLERFCRNLAINMESMKPLLEAYWAFPSTEHITDLDDWRMGLKFFWWEDEEEMPTDLLARLDHLGEPFKTDFRLILDRVADIGMSCMYGGTTDWPWTNLMETFTILGRYNIPLPDFEPFHVSSSIESHGWGDPVAPEVVEHWKRLFLEQAT